MLQAHSPLWHYLWVAPNVLLLILAFLLWRLQLHKQFPTFWYFAIVTASLQLTVYVADILPLIGPYTWWRVFWASLLIGGLIKFVLIGEIFSVISDRYCSLAKVGRRLISGCGTVLVLLATVVAAYTPKNNPHWIVAGENILEQTFYMIECGLILFLFAFAAYFRLRWPRAVFGITLGLGISACVHLGTWAVIANGAFPNSYRILLVFLNMATYHVCVLIWFYYLLVPQKSVTTSTIPPLEHHLELWNRELERLLQQ
jgi:hypothetical protein